MVAPSPPCTSTPTGYSGDHDDDGNGDYDDAGEDGDDDNAGDVDDYDYNYDSPPCTNQHSVVLTMKMMMVRMVMMMMVTCRG